LRRTLTILLVSMLHAGCSTCSIWDECEPGEERSCDPDGCGDCVKATETCRDNHEWGPCVCIEHRSGCGRYDPYDPDAYDPGVDWWVEPTPEDIAFDLPLDEELDPGTDEAEDADEEDADPLDAEEDGEDAPEDAGES
jgi:hypothetical protein